MENIKEQKVFISIKCWKLTYGNIDVSLNYKNDVHIIGISSQTSKLLWQAPMISVSMSFKGLVPCKSVKGRFIHVSASLIVHAAALIQIQNVKTTSMEKEGTVVLGKIKH